MATYKITYTTDKLPETLPSDAKVEVTSRLPIDFRTDYSGKRVRLFKEEGEFFIVVDKTNVLLNKGELRTLALGAAEAAGLELGAVDRPTERLGHD